MSAPLTPKQIVEQLDRYIIGQKEAKRSVAVALRNRYRRSKLDARMREEIIPKNILMIGPTGVGKTEIARRLAKIVHAPFVKFEATKFTEVGYVGRDVESMVRDLVETSVRLVREEKMKQVESKAEAAANKKLVELLVPGGHKSEQPKNPLEFLFGGQTKGTSEADGANHQADVDSSLREKRLQAEKLLRLGELEDRLVSVEVTEQQGNQVFDLFQNAGMEQFGANLQNLLGNLGPRQTKKKKLKVKEARRILTREEAEKLLDMDEVTQEAVDRAEQSGIIFIDEIDKITGKGQNAGEVSREGVQRDILPIVEGSTVMTKYGPVKTDYVLFIAAGAFHLSKPSDLIPELQGRFPIRVELKSLSVDDFVNILVKPNNALIKQYKALLETEGIKIKFSDEAIHKMASIAYEVNQDTDNIGARRLHTILEKLLEDLSFEAPDITLQEVVITPEYVDEKLSTIAKNRDLSQFIL
ncbi:MULTISPECIES: ATP-dependent protease ATPase subunit HslU [unclassified Sporolactobacillus]|uniref:ATP-dependent protease ATPase subunit HslU n=1 Tax=unclassified Sporolactobacillus TaxID=2628533 RepID=UPI0023683FAE|nr:ATP-dependent protease ATPase subunit HslU [Sporolactobacillus sp. CQH2019]MDD9147072.1 ATP-dependent protease ATPase subunit HslU [Sporolactobacillus sp. CQH2019]